MKKFIVKISLIVQICIVVVDAFYYSATTTSNCRHDLSSSSSRKQMTATSKTTTNDVINNDRLNGLKVAVIGSGPSGLLVTKYLLQSGASNVHVYEKLSNVNHISRMYTLGLGIRGKTAIQNVDTNLWDIIEKQYGYYCEKFFFHIFGPIKISLRTGSKDEQPSLLVFQSDLCQAILDNILKDETCKDRLHMNFNCEVNNIDLKSKTITTTNDDKEEEQFDLIIGCDGSMNSIVREAMSNTCPIFTYEQEILPDLFKFAQITSSSNDDIDLHPSAVHGILPKKGGKIPAFIVPASNKRFCVLFAGKDNTDPLLSSTNVTEIVNVLQTQFLPKLNGINLQSIAEQLIQQNKPGQACMINCNMYHYDSSAVLLGDAAHATGGSSGQGANSALQDSVRLVQCLNQYYNNDDKVSSLQQALLSYSQLSVPEGKALYDLSLGPKPTSIRGKLNVGIKSVKDFIFKGKYGIGEKPLHTMLTTTTTPFAEIRTNRDKYYEVEFPHQQYWNEKIIELDSKTKQTTTTSAT